MFNPSFIRNAINRSAQNGADRRRFLKVAGAAGLGFAGATYLGGGSAVAGAGPAPADEGPSDAAILNFALNLEYLEAEFYLRSLGEQLPDDALGGVGTPGEVTGGREVPFSGGLVEQYAREIADDEKAHVLFLRSALGEAAVARPAIDIDAAFKAAAMAAGLGENFDAYASEENFLLAAFIFEDVGVTAYKGAAPLVDNPTFVEAAAGILAVEAYHAANIRSALNAKGVEMPELRDSANAISDARDSLDGPSDLDQGIFVDGQSNIVPSDANGLAFSRSPGQVLNIVYLNNMAVTSGGFFPAGVNGELNTSAAN